MRVLIAREEPSLSPIEQVQAKQAEWCEEEFLLAQEEEILRRNVVATQNDLAIVQGRLRWASDQVNRHEEQKERIEQLRALEADLEGLRR